MKQFITQFAQANPSGEGASRADDFQPPTGNPQTVPGQIFPETPNLQNPTTSELLQNGTLQINVPSSGSTSKTEITQANPDNTLFIIVLVLIAVILIVTTWWRNARKLIKSPYVAEVQSELPKQSKSQKKSKKQSKKKKRR